jgi:hypothetical protein
VLLLLPEIYAWVVYVCIGSICECVGVSIYSYKIHINALLYERANAFVTEGNHAHLSLQHAHTHTNTTGSCVSHVKNNIQSEKCTKTLKKDCDARKSSSREQGGESVCARVMAFAVGSPCANEILAPSLTCPAAACCICAAVTACCCPGTIPGRIWT